ncbi:MAG: EAL domain-containing protein [Magnetococcales bacterium]|nr:EAL domain-containing protein [Magnetococcales bacterium]MBF0151261.1 EAL domain-containing protein [Magnetococcales bacterium]
MVDDQSFTKTFQRTMKRFAFTLHHLLLFWSVVGLLSVLVLGGAGIVAIDRLKQAQGKLLQIALPLETSSLKISLLVNHLIENQNAMNQVRSLKGIDAPETELQQGQAFQDLLETIMPIRQHLGSSFEQSLHELRDSFGIFQHQRKRFITMIRRDLELHERLALNASLIDRAIDEVSKDAEHIRGKVRLATVREKRRIRNVLNAESTEGNNEELRRLSRNHLLGHGAVIWQTVVRISSSVATLGILTRQIMLEESPDVLTSILYNEMTPLIQSTYRTLDDLGIQVRESPTLTETVQRLKRSFTRLDSHLVIGPDSAYALRRARLALDRQRIQVQEKTSRAVAAVTNSLEKFSDFALRTREESSLLSEQVAATSQTLVFMFGGSMAIFMVVFGILMTRRIIRPMALLSHTLVDLEKEGNFSVQIDYSRQDEIGQAVGAMNRLLGNLKTAFSDIKNSLDSAAEGTFEPCNTVVLQGDLKIIKSNIDRQINTLGNIYRSQTINNLLLETALEPMSLEQQLDTVLRIIFSTSWFSFKPKGAIFLVDERSGHLVLSAHRGFDDEHLKVCARIRPGQCLCGKALQSKEMLFSSCINDLHEIHLENMQPHGHYVVPIMAREQCYGVINLYVEEHHVKTPEEEALLVVLSNTIIGLIDRRRIETALKHQAEYDKLTGLPNRALFQIRLSQHMAMAARSDREVVVMFLDLDRFKWVNDTMGHEAGDQLLREAAARIQSCIRQYDTLCRLGGDEFTIVLPQLTHVYYVEFVARRILEELAKPFALKQGEANISGSIGIAIYPGDGEDLEKLIKNADTAMYQAKSLGRNTFQFFTMEMQARAASRLSLEKALRQALEQGEFELYYQPKLNLTNTRVTGMEALLRWARPGFGLVPPTEFIPLAEETGLIIPLGAWVIKTACQQNKSWQDQGFAPMRVAVNLSARQFRQTEDLFVTVLDALNVSGLEPEFLELEITESMVMEDMEKAIQIMKELQAMRIHISIDDFGTGYSSLGSLRRFPLKSLKIDRSFIHDLAGNSDDAAITRSIISMARQLNLNVIAEGVETMEQWNFLKENGCNEIQGFFLSRPLPVKEFGQFLETHDNRIPSSDDLLQR